MKVVIVVKFGDTKILKLNFNKIYPKPPFSVSMLNGHSNLYQGILSLADFKREKKYI